MADNPRIEELRRRIQKDPASIAFAQLAEEHRRSGNYEEAIAACRAGLAIHPGYLSARVTLGRALIEVNDLDGAAEELKRVLQSAPENLAAIRGLAEIHHRRGHLDEALGFYQAALNLAKHDPDLEQAVDEITRAIAPERQAITDGLSFEEATAEFLSALDAFEAAPAFAPQESIAPAGRPAAPQESIAPAGTPIAFAEPVERLEPNEPLEPPALPELEKFLDAIHTYRQRRAV